MLDAYRKVSSQVKASCFIPESMVQLRPKQWIHTNSQTKNIKVFLENLYSQDISSSNFNNFENFEVEQFHT